MRFTPPKIAWLGLVLFACSSSQTSPIPNTSPAPSASGDPSEPDDAGGRAIDPVDAAKDSPADAHADVITDAGSFVDVVLPPLPPEQDASSACAAGDLAGGTYDVTMSKFAFGGPYTTTVEANDTRYTGPDGVIVIRTNGGAIASSNGNSPARTVDDWSTDPVALTAHVVPYLESFGIDDCQASPTIFAQGMGSGGPDGSTMTTYKRTVVLRRVIDGISISESLASARVNANDESDQEDFYWPPIPGSVVSDAKALRDAMVPGSAFYTAYVSKLPPNAKNGGRVVIHHTSSFAGATIHAVATWDANNFSFDADANMVDLSKL